MSQAGLAVGATWTPLGSHLTAAAAAGATSLTVEHGADFPTSGGTLDLNGVQLGYTHRVGDVLTLSTGLPKVADVDDPVSLVTGGKVAGLWHLLVDFGAGDVVPVPLPLVQRSHWPLVESYDDPIPVVVSDDLQTVIDAPERTPGYLGTYAVDESVTADKLSVGANGIVIANGTFEDTTLGDLFAGWWTSFWFSGSDRSKVHVDEAVDGAQIAGSRSLVIRQDDGNHGGKVLTANTPLPVRPGQVFTLSGMVSAGSTIASDPSSADYPALASLMFQTSTAAADPDDIFNPNVTWQETATDSLTTTPAQVSQTFTVPDGHTRLRVACRTHPSGTVGWSGIFDQITLTEVLTAPTATVVIDDWSTFRDALGRKLSDVYTLTPGSAGLTFAATASRWYGSGGTRKDGGRPEIKAGNSSDSFGNRRGAIWWDSAAVATALGSGAGYTKVEIRLTVIETVKATATLRLGTHTDGTVRDDWADITGKTSATLASAGLVEGQTVWVDITSILSVANLVAQSKKGLVLGPAPDLTFPFGIGVAGFGASSTTAPLLRVS